MKSLGEKVEFKEVAVEALLERAKPRQAPPLDDERIVRDAVHAQWQAVTRKRRVYRRTGQAAIAASVIVATVLAFNTFRITGIAPVEVATIGKVYGPIYLLGERSELRELPDLTSIAAGQTIVTGEGAGVGLSWSQGGSLRIDENTRIEFTSADSVRLLSGRIYFDSRPVAAITGSGVPEAAFVVETEQGSVAHVGTQYMTSIDNNTLTVSVREGEVGIDDLYFAYAGQQLRLTEAATPSITNVSHFGTAWEWIEQVSPSLDIDGRSTHEFLQWVGRETGLEVSYTSPDAEEIARAGELRGTVDTTPREALDIWMSGELLRTEITGGKLFVSAISSGSQR